MAFSGDAGSAMSSPAEWLRKLADLAQAPASLEVQPPGDDEELCALLGDAPSESANTAALLLQTVGCVTVGNFRLLLRECSAEGLAMALMTASTVDVEHKMESKDVALDAVRALAACARIGDPAAQLPPEPLAACGHVAGQHERGSVPASSLMHGASLAAGAQRFAGLAAPLLQAPLAGSASGAKHPSRDSALPPYSTGHAAGDFGQGARAWAPWDDVSLSGAAPAARPDLTELLQKAIGSHADSDANILGLEEKHKKIDFRTLIDQARLGEPSPEALPQDSEMKKLAAAARLGLSSPPSVFAGLEGNGLDPAKISKWLMDFATRAIGDLLLWRASPMGILSELYQIGAIGADPAFSPSEGLLYGMKYSYIIHDKMYTHTRSHPLSKDPQVFSQELSTLEKAWATRGEDSLTAAKRSVAASSTNSGERRSSQRPANADGDGPYEDRVCLWHGLKKCTQRNCKRSHVRPFCKGSDCSSHEGYLAVHLGKLRTPYVITQMAAPATASAGTKRGTGSNPPQTNDPKRGRSPSRRRSRSRRGRRPSPVRDRR